MLYCHPERPAWDLYDGAKHPINTWPFGRLRDPTLGALDHNTTTVPHDPSTRFANKPVDYEFSST
jgi:hypothetical protein